MAVKPVWLGYFTTTPSVLPAPTVAVVVTVATIVFGDGESKAFAWNSTPSSVRYTFEAVTGLPSEPAYVTVTSVETF
jgi:hypothetical protein